MAKTLDVYLHSEFVGTTEAIAQLVRDRCEHTQDRF